MNVAHAALPPLHVSSVTNSQAGIERLLGINLAARFTQGCLHGIDHVVDVIVRHSRVDR
jgi:hypothetical protein